MIDVLLAKNKLCLPHGELRLKNKKFYIRFKNPLFFSSISLKFIQIVKTSRPKHVVHSKTMWRTKCQMLLKQNNLNNAMRICSLSMHCFVATCTYYYIWLLLLFWLSSMVVFARACVYVCMSLHILYIYTILIWSIWHNCTDYIQYFDCIRLFCLTHSLTHLHSNTHNVWLGMCIFSPSGWLSVFLLCHSSIHNYKYF